MQVITERLGIATGGEPYHDIRFALMALVPDAITSLQKKLSMLKINRDIVIQALRQLLKLYYQRKIDSSLVKKRSSVVDDEAVKSPTKTEVKKLTEEVMMVLKDEPSLEQRTANTTDEVHTVTEKIETDMKVEEVDELMNSAETVRESSPRPETKPSKSLVNKVISRCSSIDSQYSGD